VLEHRAEKRHELLFFEGVHLLELHAR
jgi:hypothetical protein